MIKRMRTNLGFELNITEESGNVLNKIHQKMNEGFFHKHVHILYDLRTFIKKEVIGYLEIGVFGGATSSLMLSHPQKSVVIGIEINGSEKHKNFIESNNINNYDFHYLVGNSQTQEMVERVKQIRENVDILFIDGDHSFQGVVNDFNLYKNLVTEGGFIVFDDYFDRISSRDVKTAVDYIVENNLHQGFEVLGHFDKTINTDDYIAKENLSNEFILRKI